MYAEDNDLPAAQSPSCSRVFHGVQLYSSKDPTAQESHAEVAQFQEFLLGESKRENTPHELRALFRATSDSASPLGMLAFVWYGDCFHGGYLCYYRESPTTPWKSEVESYQWFVMPTEEEFSTLAIHRSAEWEDYPYDLSFLFGEFEACFSIRPTSPQFTVRLKHELSQDKQPHGVEFKKGIPADLEAAIALGIAPRLRALLFPK